MKIEGKRIRSLKFLENIKEIENKRIGVILENTQVPEELKIMGTGKFRPNINWGKSSKRNTIGEYKTNKDLPKIDKYINTIEWHWKQYNGRDLDDMYDFFDIYRKVYQKEFIQPLEVDFVFIEERNVIYACIDLNSWKENQDKVLISVNILLEKFGFCQILNENFDEYIPEDGFKNCNWEILPPGEEIWDVLGTKKYYRPNGEENRKRATFESYRITKILEKNPEEKYKGINGFQDYLVFVFDKLCVLETQKYGNATYIIKKQDWKYASTLSKKELLNSEFIIDRIIHNEEWNKKIDGII